MPLLRACILIFAKMPEPDLSRTPTRKPISFQLGEQVQGIAWHGGPVLVLTRPGPFCERLYLLARRICQSWKTAAGLRFESRPPS